MLQEIEEKVKNLETEKTILKKDLEDLVKNFEKEKKDL